MGAARAAAGAAAAREGARGGARAGTCGGAAELGGRRAGAAEPGSLLGGHLQSGGVGRRARPPRVGGACSSWGGGRSRVPEQRAALLPSGPAPGSGPVLRERLATTPLKTSHNAAARAYA